MLDRDATDYPGAPVSSATALLPLLRILSRLSVGVEIDFINAGLPAGSWFGTPSTRLKLDLAQSFHGQAAPSTNSFWRHRQSAVAPASKLIGEHVKPA